MSPACPEPDEGWPELVAALAQLHDRRLRRRRLAGWAAEREELLRMARETVSAGVRQALLLDAARGGGEGPGS